MIRNIAILSAIIVSLLGTTVLAERVDIDLRDYDDELMRDLDRTIKYFEPDIIAKNVSGATEDAEILEEGFRYTEDYFARKGNAEDAVKISRQGLQFIGTALERLEQNDFDGAAEAARETARTCRACHDIYKPLKK